MTNKSNFDYTSEKDKLNKLVEEIKSGEISIDQMINKYNDAKKIVDDLKKYLETARNNIKKLK